MRSSSSSDPRILYAITGHGYGHATRAVAIAAEVRRRHPRFNITCSTAVPRSFLDRRGSSGGYRLQDYEPGTLDRICFEVDPDATRGAYRRFFAERERRIAQEVEHLKAGGYCGVVSDVAALAIAAASRAGVPAVAVSNFTWDWILEPYLTGEDRGILEALREDYRSAEVYLRLPFHPPEHPFRKVEDLPLVGRRAELPRAEVRSRLGLPAGSSRQLVLVTIGGFSGEGWPPVRVPGLSGLDFAVVGRIPLEFPGAGVLALPDDLRTVPSPPGPPEGAEVGFTDLVAAADLVVSKAGYGICSECAAAGTPLLCLERSGFRESAVLRDSLAKMLPCREIPLREFLAGRWAPFVEELLAAPRPPPVPTPGAAVAADRIVELLGR